MKLLFDENLSPGLVGRLADLFPSSKHVDHVGLSESEDSELWSYAAEHGFAIASKDSDFVQMSLLRGAPPKVIRLQVGNCTTAKVEAILRSGHVSIETFDRDVVASLLVLPTARRITSL